MLSKDIVSDILKNRGIPPEEQDAFLHPDFSRDVLSPWDLPGMEVAIDRLQAAKDQKIVLFGDYDADGVPATALLLNVLRRLGYSNVEGMIPTREQGYGLTPTIVALIAEKNPELVITVDNGTVAADEVSALKALGIDVIIIDHHEPQVGKVAEAALAIINPKMPNATYGFTELCACGLAWKVALALTERLGGNTEDLKWDLDLVALSTVADMVPLIGENRVLTHFGLKVCAKSRNEGLKALFSAAGVQGNIKASDLSFKVAPRINAPSRMHDELFAGEHISLTLLTTKDPNEAYTLARELNLRNAERQELVEAHLTEAHNQVSPEALVIVAYHEQWSTGVIGLVASRLVERYRRPAVVMAPEGESVKGSVRSIEGVHALELLEAGSAELERFGGHVKAAGLTLSGSIDRFREALASHMQDLGITLEALAEAYEKVPDALVSPADITLELAQEIEKLAPFGVGFPTPLFAVEAKPTKVRKVGVDGKHTSFFITDGDFERKAIAFSYRGPELVEGQMYRFYVNIETEEWRDVVSATCHVRRVEMLDNASQFSE